MLRIARYLHAARNILRNSLTLAFLARVANGTVTRVFQEIRVVLKTRRSIQTRAAVTGINLLCDKKKRDRGSPRRLSLGKTIDVASRGRFLPSPPPSFCTFNERGGGGLWRKMRQGSNFPVVYGGRQRKSYGRLFFSRNE